LIFERFNAITSTLKSGDNASRKSIDEELFREAFDVGKGFIEKGIEGVVFENIIDTNHDVEESRVCEISDEEDAQVKPNLIRITVRPHRFKKR
jgi:hypothetical protein